MSYGTTSPYAPGPRQAVAEYPNTGLGNVDNGSRIHSITRRVYAMANRLDTITIMACTKGDQLFGPMPREQKASASVGKLSEASPAFEDLEQALQALQHQIDEIEVEVTRFQNV